jgi:sugar lactone lactonase YvrE
VKQYPAADTGLPDNAVPDGMTIDTDGKLWLAFYNGYAVCKIDPETGRLLAVITIIDVLRHNNRILFCLSLMNR